MMSEKCPMLRHLGKMNSMRDRWILRLHSFLTALRMTTERNCMISIWHSKIIPIPIASNSPQTWHNKRAIAARDIYDGNFSRTKFWRQS